MQQKGLFWLPLCFAGACLMASEAASSVKHPPLPGLLRIRPGPGVTSPPAAASSRPSEGPRSKGRGSLAPVPPRRPSYDTNRVVPSPGRRSVAARVSSAVTRRRGRHRSKGRAHTARRLPGVSRPARGLLLAFLPAHRNRPCARGRASETGQQKQGMGTVIMRS